MSESDASRIHLKAYGQKRNTWICLISISKMSSHHVKKERKVGKNRKFSCVFYSYKATVFLLNWDFTTIKAGKTQKACDQA